MTKLTDQQICIKLAEEMGYRPYPDADTPCWWSPDGLTIHTLTDEFPHLSTLPDPLNDANDCEELIRHLAKGGWCFTIMCKCGGSLDSVCIWQMGFKNSRDPEKCRYWEGDDYKRGVCELALKVMT